MRKRGEEEKNRQTLSKPSSVVRDQTTCGSEIVVDSDQIANESVTHENKTLPDKSLLTGIKLLMNPSVVEIKLCR